VSDRLAAVLFDFGGTLDGDGVPWKARVSRFYREEGVTVAPDAFDPIFYAADDALVGTVARTLSFRETVHRLVEGVARGLGTSDPRLVDRVATRFVDEALQIARRNADLLTALGRRYRLGVVSNFYGNLGSVCDDCGLGPLFEIVVDSEHVGIRKPDPGIFRIGLDALGLAPAAAVFVGDSATRDMAGARAMGLPHVWLLAGTAVDAAPCCPGDRVIRSLPELEEMLL
jgi:putative hydrolase of the HAD superfamily